MEIPRRPRRRRHCCCHSDNQRFARHLLLLKWLCPCPFADGEFERSVVNCGGLVECNRIFKSVAIAFLHRCGLNGFSPQGIGFCADGVVVEDSADASFAINLKNGVLRVFNELVINDGNGDGELFDVLG